MGLSKRKTTREWRLQGEEAECIRGGNKFKKKKEAHFPANKAGRDLAVVGRKSSGRRNTNKCLREDLRVQMHQGVSSDGVWILCKDPQTDRQKRDV